MASGKLALRMRPKPKAQRASVTFHILAGAALLVFIESFSLLSPILLSLLLILLISLAVNPVISRLRTGTGGRMGAIGLVAVALMAVLCLTGWAFFGPMKASVIKLSEKLPAYWERLQKPLIKMEQQAERSEVKLQAEVSTEIAQDAAAAGEPEAARPPARRIGPPQPVSKTVSLRASLSEMIQGVVGRFTAVAFNAAQILIVLVTVFFGVIYTLMNPRPMFGALFSLVPER